MKSEDILHWLVGAALLASTLCLFAVVGCVTTQPSLLPPTPAPATLRIIPAAGSQIKLVSGSNDRTNWIVLGQVVLVKGRPVMQWVNTNSFRYIKCQNHL